ncbi:enediyne antibiotic chromoprotein [Streptomyces mirabilis]|uniref:enediyne antibiotic chromoprotein n=1 Tax=Streptomyces mirabilis TaxID=68239 RepID=UPI00368C62D7
MISKKRIALISKAGLTGAAAVAAMLAVSVPATAAATAVGVTVTPSTGLSDGASVTVNVTGFGAAEAVSATECAGDPAAGTLVCDVAGIKQLTTDATGAGSTAFTVKKTFQGQDQSGATVDVNCATIAGGCFIGASNEAQNRDTAAISFA